MDKQLKMSQALYILEASLMTVQKTYKDYSSNNCVQREDKWDND